jgi:hypothetical protein
MSTLTVWLNGCGCRQLDGEVVADGAVAPLRG